MSLISLLAGCFLYKLRNIHYDYHKPTVFTERGFINMSFNPDPSLVIKGNKETVIWTSPYFFNTQYISTEYYLCRGEISNVVIRGKDSRQVIATKKDLLDVRSESNMISNCAESKAHLIGFGFEMGDMAYEDYIVSFDYVIYGNNNNVYDSGHAETIIERHEFKDYR